MKEGHGRDCEGARMDPPSFCHSRESGNLSSHGEGVAGIYEQKDGFPFARE